MLASHIVRCFLVTAAVLAAEVPEKAPGTAKEEAAPGNIAKKGASLFCFTVYRENTGSIQPDRTLELLRTQYTKRVGIFACDRWAVYSDVEVVLAEGAFTRKVDDVQGDFYYAKYRSSGRWVNTGFFMGVWKAIQQEGFKMHDWVVKVDAGVVFLPQHLSEQLLQQVPPQAGLLLTSAESVQTGHFGSVQIFSTLATNTFLANIDMCQNTINWKVATMPEDQFAAMCSQLNGVLTKDLKNDHWRPACKQNKQQPKGKKKPTSPTKGPKGYFQCLNAAATGSQRRLAEDLVSASDMVLI